MITYVPSLVALKTLFVIVAPSVVVNVTPSTLELIKTSSLISKVVFGADKVICVLTTILEVLLLEDVLDVMLLVELDVILLVMLDVVSDDVTDESEVILLDGLLLETWLSLDVVPSPKQPVNKPAVTNPRTIDLMLFFIRFLLSSAISKLFFYVKESKQYL